MQFWATLKRDAIDYIRRSYGFYTWAAFGVLVLRVMMGLSWSFIWPFLIGLYGARLLAEDIVQRWSANNISPGMTGGPTMVSPRVWTFTPQLTTTFLGDVSAQLSTRLLEIKDITDRPGITPWKAYHATSEFLQKVVVEEYPSRVRVHLWLVSASEPYIPRYDWFDLDRANDRGDRCLWAYATQDWVGGSLTLSGAWKADDMRKQRRFFQLTLWVDHAMVRSYTGGTPPIPPTDLIWQIPLEPGRLCAKQGQPEEEDPFPYQLETWEEKAGEGDDWRWSWHLHMQTFTTAISL